MSAGTDGGTAYPEWQPIETAPRDGKTIDLWGVNHLHPSKTGRRAVDVSWGRVRDWMGNERDDWQHGQGEDFEPTHWMPLPPPPGSTTQSDQALIERLREALTPFADESLWAGPQHEFVTVKLADCDAARAILAETERSHG